MPMKKADGEDFQPTPREQSVMDQNMAHARNCVVTMVGNARYWANQGLHGDTLRDKVLDGVLACSDVGDWPGLRITPEAAVIAMLIEAVMVGAGH